MDLEDIDMSDDDTDGEDGEKNIIEDLFRDSLHHACDFAISSRCFVDISITNEGHDVRQKSDVMITATARATSFILILGVGSYLCYKFYLQLRRKFQNHPQSKSGESPSDRSSKSHRSVSRSLSSHWSACDRLIEVEDQSVDPQNIERRYFGPENPNDESTLSLITDFSEEGSFPSSLVYSDSDNALSHCNNLNEKENMGNFNSRYAEPVFYNVDTGIHFKESPDQRTRRIAERLQNVFSPARSKKLTATLNRIANKQTSPSVLKRPNHLPLNNSHNKSNEFSTSNDLNLKYESSGFTPSSYINESSAFPSEMESLCDSWSCDERAWSQNGSLKGNFSPASLRQKSFKFSSSDQSEENSAASNSKFYVREDSFNNFYDSGSEYSGYSSNYFRTSGGESLCTEGVGLNREFSIDSVLTDEASELCSLEPIPESIAVETLNCFNQIESEVMNIKHVLLEIDSEILSKQTGKPPLFRSLSFSDTFDGAGDKSDSSISNQSAVAFVQRHKERITNRGLLGSKRSDSISSQKMSPSVISMSTPQSHGSFSYDSDKSFTRQRGISLPITPMSIIDTDSFETDSGSDFGQSLSSDSPKKNLVPVSEKNEFEKFISKELQCN
ncbi:hypothetical protein GQR58_005448 [Nymphon striatum]|nr:hypothetical protein GQR58_005448 [Nymphon striatum]